MAAWFYVLVAFVAISALLYNPVKQKLVVFGVFRNVVNIHGEQLKIIPNTLHCEDLHHHAPSDLLFAACQTEKPAKRKLWFPPLAHFNTTGVSEGAIVVVDPKTFQSTQLKLKGFKGPFITHGIDIYYVPADPMHVTIFAINHLPHPNAGDPTNAQHARSQIEVFRHTVGTDTAYFVRSVQDPLIATPNDIYATSPSSFYVTNDHHYRDGPMRIIEDFGSRSITGWTTTIHVSFSDVPTRNGSLGVKATVGLTGLHNNNGLGHSSVDEPDIVLIGCAASGEVAIAKRKLNPKPNNPKDLNLEILEYIQLDSSVDNPSYYVDPYATENHNSSGIVLAGLPKAVDLHPSIRDDISNPAIVWLITRQADGGWNKKVIFQDDGRLINTAATAVLLPVDPAENAEGKKKAWLFVTGFLSEAMIATLIDL